MKKIKTKAFRFGQTDAISARERIIFGSNWEVRGSSILSSAAVGDDIGTPI